ncbi:MAG: DUF2490 domain-containing protein [Dysgonamonadaceae bacterium]|jgi:hypothetical protein|nr:DUF2490 domain-containing protein [Dysgonamonadaceae bacterium]
MLPGFHKRLLIGLLVTIPWLAPAQVKQETNAGMVGSFQIEKDLGRAFTLAGEEEIRLTDNNVGFDRSATSIGLDYTIWRKRVKVGAYYSFLYLYNNDYLYEARHRYYFNISYKQPVNEFTFSWRGRFQSTYRDEDRGSYKINPKNVLKNKIEVDYTIFGSPWKPYVSCDFSTTLNDPVRNYELTRIRYQAGTNWRLDRTTTLEFFLRYDNYLGIQDPNRFSLGVSYKMKLIRY